MFAPFLKLLKPCNQSAHRHPYFRFHTDFSAVLYFFHYKSIKLRLAKILRLKLNWDLLRFST